MFTLQDGRECLWQWDLNRKIIVEDPEVTEVHFCNRTDDCSLVVEVKDGMADIPNILLQDTWNIRVYAYCDEYTKVEETFKIKPRTKPSDYVYTETEVLRWETLNNRIDELESDIKDIVEDEVSNYLEENPIQVDLSGYATEEYVDNAIANIDIPEVDLSSYVTTDTEQEITGAKTFTSSIKVTDSTNTATLSNRAVTFTDSSAPGVTLSNPINEYGLRIFFNGSGYVADGESKCLFFYDDNQHDYATLGKKASPWYRAYIKNLSDGTTTKSMTDILAAPTMDEVNQAIQDAINAIATAEGGSY